MKISPPIYLATAIDITDRHKAETELRRFAAYLAEAEKLSHTGCWARIPRPARCSGPRRNGVSSASTRKRRSLSYQVFLELVHPEDRAALEEDSSSALRKRSGLMTFFFAP